MINFDICPVSAPNRSNVPMAWLKGVDKWTGNSIHCTYKSTQRQTKKSVCFDFDSVQRIESPIVIDETLRADVWYSSREIAGLTVANYLVIREAKSFKRKGYSDACCTRG